MSWKYKHFYANACHVCKQFGIILLRCKFCDIAYCSRVHRRLYKSQHEQLCGILRDLEIYPADSIIEGKYNSGRAWSKFKENCIQRVESNLKRSLRTCEKEMFLFPRSCIICHKRDNLTDCGCCASISCCANHKATFKQ